MGGMEPNPYQAPDQPVPTLPRKVTFGRMFGARMFRVGGILVATGAAVTGLGYCVGSSQYGEPPLWFFLPLAVAMVMVPVGIVIAIIGGAIWGAGRFRAKRTSKSGST